MHGKGADRCHAETLHALAPPECLNVTQRGVGVVEWQTQHREKTIIGFRQDLLGQPAIIGPAQIVLEIGLRGQPHMQHLRRKQAGVVDAQRVHPAIAQLHIAMLSGPGLL